ncbi:FadR/GntR family transcriptional regulator [Cryptosporangium aurantiacum]|uniref:Transcriptional regulator, GntR family n=1 Tax=Cryptosporangium aurantiacum TaxID=134849 RepID=A0A1M7R4H0_9ACTN|nr:FCD domain-containing protein [Cryptosporangium aurantiacum]SHN39902.1 transcriptional regulator, GntR family [Cryptosporangium aurantiacum]
MAVADVVPSGSDSTAEVLDVEHPDDATVGKLAAQVARRIEADVVRRGWPVGELLGSEPELRERYGVSRSVLREAVRLVEHHQVARMRRGPNGGLFVSPPDAGPAAQAVVIYLEYVGASVADLIEARRLLEPLAAGLAAQHVTEDGIDLVRRTIDAETITDSPEDRTTQPLHVVLSELSTNPVLRLFIDVLIRLTNRYTDPSGIPPRDYRRARAEAVRRHAEIADAVIAGDRSKAEAWMGDYLEAISGWMLKYSRTPHSGLAGSSTIPAGEETPGAKLAEVVASRLREEIASSGWSVGTVLGSEADLLARYGISRAVLREAVRLLEYHSVARMRRGPGGGLVVGSPDPQASIDTMALYLEYQRVTGADLVMVRDAIELGLISRVTGRYHDPLVAERLEEAVTWTGDGTADDEDWAEHYHEVLAELAGNPVLALFLRILAELWRRHTNKERAEISDSARAEVEHVHRRITEAVLAGDEGLARHRMRRHLTAVTEWWH